MRLKVRVCGGNRWDALFSELPLEIEGKRAFVIWDTTTVGDFQLQARIEVNPKLLKRIRGRNAEYTYRGELVLPRPQDN